MCSEIKEKLQGRHVAVLSGQPCRRVAFGVAAVGLGKGTEEHVGHVSVATGRGEVQCCVAKCRLPEEVTR